MSTDGQRIKWRRNIAENFNRLSRVHERYRRQMTDRQTTDRRATANSEREREFTLFTFAKKPSGAAPRQMFTSHSPGGSTCACTSQN